MSAIAVFYRGRIGMLEAIFGKSPPTPPGPDKRKSTPPVKELPAITPDAFDRMFP